jgi:hypothetical protein
VYTVPSQGSQRARVQVFEVETFNPILAVGGAPETHAPRLEPTTLPTANEKAKARTHDETKENPNPDHSKAVATIPAIDHNTVTNQTSPKKPVDIMVITLPATVGNDKMTKRRMGWDA